MPPDSDRLDLDTVIFKIKLEAEQTFLRDEALRRVPGRAAPDIARLRAWIHAQDGRIIDAINRHLLGNPFHAAHLALVDAAADAHAAGAFDPAPPGNG